MVMGRFSRESREKSSRRRTRTKIPTRKETARLRRRTLQLQECGSGARSRSDDDFEGYVQFFAVPEFFQGGENFCFGLSQFFRRELVDERAEGRGDFAELLPIFFDGGCPASGDDAVFLMDIAEPRRLQRAPEPAALPKHEHARAIGIRRGRRHRNMLQYDSRGGGEERLLFLAPGDERGAPAGLAHAEAFAERIGQIVKKHDAEATG